MLFNSFEFLIFFPLVLALYYALSLRGQNLWLLLASYFFYGWWDWRFCSLLAFSTVLDYFCALSMARWPKRKRIGLTVSMVASLGILGFFKYFNFSGQSPVLRDESAQVVGRIGSAAPDK